MRKITERQQAIRDRHYGVAQLYKSGKFTTERIAKNYGISPRQVQRICSAAGVIRTQAEANRLIAPLKDYSKHRIPSELRSQRHQITLKRRYRIIAAHPFCDACGMTAAQGVRLEVDHVDEDATNNADDNLQVLYNRCNLGKSHLKRYGDE